MILGGLTPTIAWESIPRESGDDPYIHVYNPDQPVYSPRERG